jgi:hypothetical protein
MTRRRVYDFLLYVLIGLGVLFAVLWYAAAGGDSELLEMGRPLLHVAGPVRLPAVENTLAKSAERA